MVASLAGSMVTAAVVALLAVGCDRNGSAGIIDGDGSVTVDITLNGDGTITHSADGFAEAVNAGTPLRVRARGINGETLYDVTGRNLADVLRKIPMQGNRRVEVDPDSPGMRALHEMKGVLPSRDELLAMTPSERASARKAFEDAMARVDAMREDALRGVK